MPVSIIDHGANNTVDIDPEHLERGDGEIELHGTGNVISIGRPQAFGSLHIRAGNGARVSMGRGCVLTDVHLDAPQGATITVGADTWFNGTVAIRADEQAGVTLGRGCLLGADVRVWSSDMHSVIDLATRRRVNPSRDVVIRDRVWLAYRALVLKGSRIGEGTILGAGSVLAGELPSNCACAGNPARVVKRGVTWDAQLLPALEIVKTRPRFLRGIELI